MIPAVEKITNQEQIEYLGMESETLKRIVVPVNLQNSVIDHSNIGPQNFQKNIENVLQCTKTPLDQCLGLLPLKFTDDSYPVVIYEKQELTVAVLHDILMMKLFPPRNTIVENSMVDFPIFEIEYITTDIPSNLNKNNVINSILQARHAFEGEFLFELLNKAVRSQRNKIEKPFDDTSISEALELIERENEQAYNILSNTKAYAIIRQSISPESSEYRGIKVINFSPNGRMNKNRVYFMGDPMVLGRVAKTVFKIDIQTKEDTYDISCLLRMGAVILNRDIISIIEH